METSNERDNQERRTGPTVSKEKWVNHARAKMARGYVLIVGTKRRSANFYLKNKGYEMCGYDVAKYLIKEGIVEESGVHSLGTVYSLAGGSSAPSVSEVDDHRSDVDVLMNHITADKPGDTPSSRATI